MKQNKTACKIAAAEKSREPAVYARVRKICVTYPEVTERSSWGHPNFRAADRTFVTLETCNGRPSVALRLAADQVRELQSEPEFFITPYGRGLWISRYLDGRPSWRGIRHLIDQSYRLVTSAAASRPRRLRNSRGPTP